MDNIVFYEDHMFYYFWKRNGISSTWWSGECFLDMLEQSDNKKIKEILKKLSKSFNKEEEFWMLNRLDKETSGLLYFAKNKEIKEQYKQAQQDNKIEKVYIADVYWEVKPIFGFIDYEIGNHRFEKGRVVVIKNEPDRKKTKGRTHRLLTKFDKLYFDKETNTTTLLVQIKRWFRHQIRAHLSSIWYPIVNEKIYIKNKKEWQLKLFCVGLKTSD